MLAALSCIAGHTQELAISSSINAAENTWQDVVDVKATSAKRTATEARTPASLQTEQLTGHGGVFGHLAPPGKALEPSHNTAIKASNYSGLRYVPLAPAVARCCTLLRAIAAFVTYHKLVT